MQQHPTASIYVRYFSWVLVVLPAIIMWSLFSASYVNVRRTVNIVCNQYIGQVLNFSKYISKSRAKRLPLTTKRAGKGYYKGNRCRKEGKLNSKGTSIPPVIYYNLK